MNEELGMGETDEKFKYNILTQIIKQNIYVALII